MPQDREEDSSANRRRRRRRRDSTPSSPEPYGERRRSRERPRTDSRGRDSRSRERNKDPRRHSYSNDKSGRDRSKSPRRRPDRRYDDREGGRSSRGADEYGDSHLHRARRHSRQRNDDRNTPVKGSRALPSQLDAFKGESTAVAPGTAPAEKQKANFSTTGRLAAESNTIKSVDGQAIVLKYHEPAEARKPPPSQAWRLYVFKGSEIMDTIELSRRSCWLFGREAAVVDSLLEHPSCSKQHAVVQFRHIEKRNEFGDKTGKVRPYVIDLETVNGTSMNGEEVPAGRYMELRDKDILKFGHSTREYVVQLPQP